MGILDEAIREHLELKRQHGADDGELKQLEDDAFGPAQRPGADQEAPDAVSEAETAFMAQPDLGGKAAPVEAAGEPPEAPEEPPPPPRREPVADVQEAPADQPDEQPAAEHEEQPAGEHEVPPAVGGHSTEERHAIASQPTEMFDVEQEFEPSEGVPPEAADPSDEELVAEEISEPRLAPAEPLESLAADEEDEDEEDDFFDEQRLSDELDQALEAPLEEEAPVVEEEYEDEEGEFEDEEEEPASEEYERPAARDDDEDVLEETPDFLEEAPEDDQLWFEQKPPKDFDFDD